jgi:hypothetical protein
MATVYFPCCHCRLSCTPSTSSALRAASGVLRIGPVFSQTMHRTRKPLSTCSTVAGPLCSHPFCADGLLFTGPIKCLARLNR